MKPHEILSEFSLRDRIKGLKILEIKSSVAVTSGHK